MRDERRADSYIVAHIMDVYYSEAANALDWLEMMTECQSGPREMLVKRWSQIKDLIMYAFKYNVNPHTGLGLAFWSEMLDEETKKLYALVNVQMAS